MIKEICELIEKNIFKFIKKNKISQSEFAELAGIPQKSFNNIICKLRKGVIPSNVTLQKIENTIKKGRA